MHFFIRSLADSSASCNHCGCALGEALAPETEAAFDRQHSISSPNPPAEARSLGTENAGGAKGLLLRARRDFADGVGAYMREDAEVRSEFERGWRRSLPPIDGPAGLIDALALF